MRTSQEKVAFCFPGQLQGRPKLENEPLLTEGFHFKECLARASRQTRYDLGGFFFNGGGQDKTGEDFNIKLQLSTYLLSMVHFYQMQAGGWTPDVLTEHSMGIYAALAASEAITFEEGLFITETIGRLLQQEEKHHPGAMASIIGLTLEEIQGLCQPLNGYQLHIANHNGSKHFVLSGEEKAVEKAIALALSGKAISATRLAFNTALHTPFLMSLKNEILKQLEDVRVQPPKVPILNHWTIQPLKQEEIKDFLSEEIGQPVYWSQCIETLIRAGVTRFVEVGHDTTLIKLIRWIDRDVEAVHARDHFLKGA